MLDRVVVKTGAAVGANGSAAATGYSARIQGQVLAVHVAYAGGKPATTDVTLSDEGDPASESIVNLANAAADVKVYPRRSVQDNANTDLLFTTGNKVVAPYLVHGRLKATVAQANTGDEVTVTAWVET